MCCTCAPQKPGDVWTLFYIRNESQLNKLNFSITSHNVTSQETILFYYGSTALVAPWPLFRFLNLYTVGRTPWTGDQAVARPLSTHRTTQTQNKHTHTFMTPVGFEPTIPMLELAKSVHALDRAATVIGRDTFCYCSSKCCV
jgi:hypothetical protein